MAVILQKKEEKKKKKKKKEKEKEGVKVKNPKNPPLSSSLTMVR